jgi:hypothetical protein
MLMTIKNKMLLGMDRLIDEAQGKGGVPSTILVEPQEAADFLREVKNLIIQYGKHVSIKHKNDTAVDIRFLLQPELTKEVLADLIKQWYKKDFVIFYKGVEIVVIRKKAPDVPVPNGSITTPPFTVHKEYAVGRCGKCGSSLHKKYLFWTDGCLQPECSNYYKK